MNETNPSKGFMYAATCQEQFLHSAIYSAQSLKDYYEDAKIVLYTEDRWLDIAQKAQVFDQIITDCPYDTRTKLYMLNHTPFQKTFYIDADTEIMHEDIQYIFDELHDNNDICITKIREYAAAEVYLTHDDDNNKKMIHHCGVFGYWNKPHTLQFMEQWYKQYLFQKTEEFATNYPQYKKSVTQWDQFAWWFLLNEKKYNMKINIMNDDAKWNFVNSYKHKETKSNIVIYHHTLPKEWINGQNRN